jgi:hypothetical protein
MARYYPDGQERWLAQNNARRLVLDDGSVWEVGDLDADKVTHWIRYSSVVVSEIEVGERSFYVLTNRSFDSDVTAKFLGLRSDGTNPLADVA